jgi:crotonobetainyl-CoA:carnitine CoA-transferase CaiB-like acyl-CoA transferase
MSDTAEGTVTGTTEATTTQPQGAAVSDTVTTATTTIAIPAAAHAEAQGIFASLATKLENFEHSLATDAKAELDKLKTLLHL